MHVTSMCLQSVKRAAKVQKEKNSPIKKSKKGLKKPKKHQQEKNSSAHTSAGAKTPNQGSMGQLKGVQVT